MLKRSQGFNRDWSEEVLTTNVGNVIIIIIVIMQRLTRCVSVIKMTTRMRGSNRPHLLRPKMLKTFLSVVPR